MYRCHEQVEANIRELVSKILETEKEVGPCSLWYSTSLHFSIPPLSFLPPLYLPLSLSLSQDWDSTQPPEADVKGAYYTTLGITLFQMVEQNVC